VAALLEAANDLRVALQVPLLERRGRVTELNEAAVRVAREIAEALISEADRYDASNMNSLMLSTTSARIIGESWLAQGEALAAAQQTVEAAHHLIDIYGQFGTGEAFWESFRMLISSVENAEDVASLSDISGASVEERIDRAVRDVPDPPPPAIQRKGSE